MNTTLIIKSVICILGIGMVIFAFIFLRTKRKEITLVIVSISVTLVICEIFLRIFLPQIDEHNKMFEYDATLGWKFVSNSKGQIVYPGEIRNYVEINSLGFRDHAPFANKKRKLLVLGDSFVSNISVEDKEVFTEIMEDKLKNYDVLNFGVNGYGQVQEYLLLRKWFNEINPDVIILVIYLQNDFTDNTGNYWFYTRPFASLEGKDSILTIHPQSKNKPAKNSASSRNIFSKSHLNILINRSINRLLPKKDSLLTPLEFYSCQWPITNDFHLKFRVMEELLLKIAGLAREKNVPVVFALAPSMLQVEDEMWSLFLEKNSESGQNYRRSLPNDRLMLFAKKNHLLMLDFLPILLQESKIVKLYHPVERHWTKEGNCVIAGSLINYLKSNSLIE